MFHRICVAVKPDITEHSVNESKFIVLCKMCTVYNIYPYNNVLIYSTLRCTSKKDVHF